MALTLVTGPANAAKASVVLDAYRAALARDPLLVVPTFADVDHYRSELAASGAVFGGTVMRFAWLVREIAKRAGARTRVLDALACEQVVVATARTTRLTNLAAAAHTPGFARAFVRLAAELAEQGVAAPRLVQALRAWAAQDPSGEPLGEDLGALYLAYHRELERLGRSDAGQAARAALDALRRRPDRWEATPIFLYGFDDLTPLQLDAIGALSGPCGADVTISLTFEPGREATKARATTYQELLALGAVERFCPPRDDHYAPGSRATLHRLERQLFEPPSGPVAERVEATPERAGAGAGVGAGAGPGALLALRGGGERAEAELVAAHVARLIRDEGYAPEEIAVAHRGVGEAQPLLSSVFAAYDVPIAIDRRSTATHTAVGRALLALLRVAVLDAGAAELLIYLRAPGIVRESSKVDALEVEVRRAGLRTAAQARAAWEEREWPLDAVTRVAAAAARGMTALCERLAAELPGLLAAPLRRTAPVLEGHALADARAVTALVRALGQIAEIPRGLQPDPAGLDAALSAVTVHAGDPPGPGRVTVDSPLALRARRVRALFCMGLVEGSFPEPGNTEPFLGDAQRRAINAASGLRLRLGEDRLDAERHLFYTAVSRPTDLLVLSWHAADDDGRPRVRSPFVEAVEEVVGFEHVEERELGEAGWLPARAPTAREQRLHEVAVAAPAQPPVVASLSEPAVLDALAQRETWSASALEAYLACPVKWFAERLLRLRPIEPDPEPLVRGELAHRVLERVFADVGRLTPERLEQARTTMQVALEEESARLRISVNPERLRAELRRLETDLVRYLEHVARSGSEFEPSHFEVRFGGRDDRLPALELGERVRIQGRIDRIDKGPGGNDAIVYDYKGKTTHQHPKWAEQGVLQMPLYMLAVRALLELDPAGGLYQPLGKRDDARPRGALRDDADPGLDVVNDRLADEDLQALLDARAAAAVAAVESIRSGALEPRPERCAFKGGCAYPSICRCEA